MDLLVAGLLIFAAAMLKGLAGFGFALAGTLGLSIFTDPSEAVKLMIVPLMAANVELVFEADREELLNCLKKFRYFILAGSFATIAGAVLIDVIPGRELKLVLGAATLLFVGSKIADTGFLKEKCFRSSNAFTTGFAAFSGTVFGATGIAVQVVSYLKYLDISHRKFKNLLAAFILGFSGLRLLTLSATGSGIVTASESALMALPALFGTYAGLRVGRFLPDRPVNYFAVALLALIGVRLLAGGLGLL